MVNGSRGRARSLGAQGFGRWERVPQTDWEVANKRFCHHFQRGGCPYEYCKFIHGFPSVEEVADQAAIRSEVAAQRREGGMFLGEDYLGEDPRASAGSTRRQSSVPAQGSGGRGSRVGIDNPNALQKGDRVKSHVVETWHPQGCSARPCWAPISVLPLP